MESDGAQVLCAVADDILAESVDRAAAAIGARVVKASLPQRKIWTTAAAVVLDETTAVRCMELRMPRRDAVLLVVGRHPAPETFQAAIGVGAQHICTLPGEERELLNRLGDAMEFRRPAVTRGRVVAVAGGRGGAGSSVFAAALAHRAGDSLLLDLDPCGGGMDLLLGTEAVPGLRWPDLHGEGGGRLGWDAIRQALPRSRAVSLLSCGRSYHEINPALLGSVIEAGRRGGATVVCDIGRPLGEMAACALDHADLAVLITTCDVRSIAAAAAAAGVLRALHPHVGLVVRGPSPGGLRAVEAAQAAGLPLLAAMRPEPMLAQRLEHNGLSIRRRSPLAVAAVRVLEAPMSAIRQSA